MFNNQLLPTKLPLRHIPPTHSIKFSLLCIPGWKLLQNSLVLSPSLPGLLHTFGHYVTPLFELFCQSPNTVVGTVLPSRVTDRRKSYGVVTGIFPILLLFGYDLYGKVGTPSSHLWRSFEAHQSRFDTPNCPAPLLRRGHVRNSPARVGC